MCNHLYLELMQEAVSMYLHSHATWLACCCLPDQLVNPEINREKEALCSVNFMTNELRNMLKVTVPCSLSKHVNALNLIVGLWISVIFLSSHLGDHFSYYMYDQILLMFTYAQYKIFVITERLGWTWVLITINHFPRISHSPRAHLQILSTCHWNYLLAATIRSSPQV